MPRRVLQRFVYFPYASTMNMKPHSKTLEPPPWVGTRGAIAFPFSELKCYEPFSVGHPPFQKPKFCWTAFSPASARKQLRRPPGPSIHYQTAIYGQGVTRNIGGLV